MTECTGRRYWRARIAEAKERYLVWCERREPKGADYPGWMAWHAWKRARIEYFNRERDLLYGNQRRNRTAHLNDTARDRRRA